MCAVRLNQAPFAALTPKCHAKPGHGAMFKLSSTLMAASAAALTMALAAPGEAAAHGGARGYSGHSAMRAPSSFSRAPSIMAQMHTNRSSRGSAGSGGMGKGGSGTGTGSTTASGGGGGARSPSPATLPQPSTGPSSTLGPMQELQPPAPLSQPLPTQITGGGTATNLALSPGASSNSTPSAPGGGGKTLADCMGFWDKDTHMSKTEWRAACKRTMAENPTIR
jgi:hypothetical protein